MEHGAMRLIDCLITIVLLRYKFNNLFALNQVKRGLTSFSFLVGMWGLCDFDKIASRQCRVNPLRLHAIDLR